MRVLQVITDRDRRGAQVFATDLAVGLTDLGCTVTTMALAPGRFDDSLPVETLGTHRLGLATLRALRRRARQHDVVIAHGSTTLPACAIALVGARRRFVYRQISDPLFWANSRMKRLRTALLVRRAAHVVALSEDVGAVFARHYRLRSGKITVIPNAVPGARFRPPTASERSEARRHLGLSDTGFVALCAGALVEEKGVDLAISATTAVPEVTLMIAGDGPQRESLEAVAARAAPERVRFLGSLPDLVPTYWASDIVVMPSRGGDSMPAVLIEAGLCGLPAVACPVGAIPEVVLDGATGFVVPIGDSAALSAALRTTADDPALTRSLGNAAEQRCRERFTVDVIAPAWKLVLEHHGRSVDHGAGGQQ